MLGAPAAVGWGAALALNVCGAARRSFWLRIYKVGPRSPYMLHGLPPAQPALITSDPRSPRMDCPRVWTAPSVHTAVHTLRGSPYHGVPPAQTALITSDCGRRHQDVSQQTCYQCSCLQWGSQVSHDLQLHPLWRIPTAAVSSRGESWLTAAPSVESPCCSCKLTPAVGAPSRTG